MKRELHVFFILCFVLPCFSQAATITSVHVEHQGKNYILHVEALIKANVNEVKRIVTDYENLPLINPYLKESRITNTSVDGRQTVTMLTEACILFFCYRIRHVQVFKLIGTDVVYGHVIPEKSDFNSGWTRWTIRKGENGSLNMPVTKVILDGEMVPDFFIFPLIGPYQLKKKIIEIAFITINRLEKEAQK